MRSAGTALDVLVLHFEHRQVAAIGEQRHFGVRQAFAIRFAIRGRHEPVLVAPEEQGGAFNAVQPGGEARIYGRRQTNRASTVMAWKPNLSFSSSGLS